MKTYSLDIPFYSLNVYRNAHHSKLHAVKRDFHELIGWQFKMQGIEKFNPPLATVFEFNFKDKKLRDLDNLAPVVKFVHDTMVELEMITEDHYRVITSVSIRVGKKTDGTVDVTIHNV